MLGSVFLSFPLLAICFSYDSCIWQTEISFTLRNALPCSSYPERWLLNPVLGFSRLSRLSYRFFTSIAYKIILCCFYRVSQVRRLLLAAAGAIQQSGKEIGLIYVF